MSYILRGRIVLSILVLAYPAYYFFAYGGRWIYVTIRYIIKTLDTFFALMKFPKKWLIHQLRQTGTNEHIQHRAKKKLALLLGTVKGQDRQILPSEQDTFSQLTSLEVIDSEQEKKIAVLVEKVIEKAILYKERGHFDEYEKKLIEGLAIDPTNEVCTKKLVSRYIHSNNHKKALSLLKKLIERNSQDHEALWQLGDIYLEQGEFEQAEMLINKAIQLAPNRPKYYVSLVEVKYNTKMLADAIVLMKKAIHLRPANVTYLLAIAGLYEQTGEIDIAKKYYFDVLELEPTNTEAKKRINRL